jgi:CRISPR-associated endonuclease/helicase Cas3
MTLQDWKPSTPEERLFDERFCALTNHNPFRWQWRLYEKFTKCEWPYQVDLPTGLGKTSIMAIWVLALGRALETGASPMGVPRRLAYVVDRRVVVDQASEEAEMIVQRLEEALRAEKDQVLHPVALKCKEAGCDDGVLALSALRGQRTQDASWRLDPARPAIIIGTVDMMGSRLLFSGYGRVGRWGRPYEAGLLAQDCLLVVDEAHLSQPFDDTLTAVEALVAQHPSIRPFAVIRMGATSRPCAPDRVRFSLEEEDREPRVQARLMAYKRIELRDTEERIAEALAEWAVQVTQRENEKGPAIGLVLNTVKGARDAHDHLRKLLRARGPDTDNMLILTGSMRGIERDEIVSPNGQSREAQLYRQFRAGRSRSTSVPAFLVATSCIEVGADIDLDHLGTEVCPLDSLVQRLGRVNRRGERREPSTVCVLVGRTGGFRASIGESVARWLHEIQQDHPNLMLEGGVLDGSPDGLPRTAAAELETSHELRVNLCGAPNPVPILSRATVDDLSMTSLDGEESDRPDVALWLHGCGVEDEGTYVELAWRQELDWLDDAGEAASLIDAFPLAPRETARCPLSEAIELLARLRSGSKYASLCVVAVRGGTSRGYSIGTLPGEEPELYRLAAWSQIALPCSVGGYKDFFVDPKATQSVTDVADEAIPETWAPRRRLWLRDGVLHATPDGEKPTAEVEEAWLVEDADELRAACQGATRELLGADWDVVAAAGSAEQGVLVARRRRTRSIESGDEERASIGYSSPVPLEQHLQDAARWADVLCTKLQLAEYHDAIIDAARSHDLGKDRPWWQRAIGATPPTPLAKSGRSGFDHVVNAGYRHEFGSLMDLLRDRSPLHNLVAHLVVSHHGYGRPAFALEAAGPLDASEAAPVIGEVAVRFTRLQQALGAWQLAYIEAIMKAADALASREVEP